MSILEFRWTILRLYIWPIIVGNISATVFSPQYEPTLLKYIEDTMTCHHMPGMTLAVVKGKDAWTKGFGKADIDTGENVTSTTLFNIGSITKGFTSTLLARILNETSKRYNWTSRLSDILGPNYHFLDEFRTKDTTLRDILSHRTGLARADVGWVAGYPKNISREELCRRLRFLPAVFPFRDTFLYNNFMYMLAGHVVEKIAGNTWESLITEKILQPIGMTQTGILQDPEDLNGHGIAQPYIFKDGMFENGTRDMYTLYPVEPSGSILSNAMDMTKWMRFHLRQGEVEDGTQLIDKKTLAEVYKVHNHITGIMSGEGAICKPRFPVEDIKAGYGYGWFTSTYRGYRRYTHGGDVISYTSLVWLFPDMDIGIFGSVNGIAALSDATTTLATIFYYMADNLLGLQPWLNSTTACTFPEPWLNTMGKEDVEIEQAFSPNPRDYIGAYGNYFFPDANISAGRNGNLLLKMNRLVTVLRPQSKIDNFMAEIVRPREYSEKIINTTRLRIPITFSRDTSGDVTEFSLTLETNVQFRRGVSLFDKIPQPVQNKRPTKSGTNDGQTYFLRLCMVAVIFVSVILPQSLY